MERVYVCEGNKGTHAGVKQARFRLTWAKRANKAPCFCAFLSLTTTNLPGDADTDMETSRDYSSAPFGCAGAMK